MSRFLSIQIGLLLLLVPNRPSLASTTYQVPRQDQEKDPNYWYSLGREDLKFALEKPVINRVAKNIIFFLGDGMGVTVATAGRIFKGQKKNGVSGEEGFLAWERFPNSAVIKTYPVDKQVADSASSATAMFTGVKVNLQTLGVTANVKLKDCNASLLQENRLTTILKWAQDSGKETGFVTTTRVSHATPAALYAHSADRRWECDADMDEATARGCKDIARQLVEDAPGADLKVIFGGGRGHMGAPLPTDADNGTCTRADGQNLVEKWLSEKRKTGKSVKYVTNAKELREMRPESTDYIMGLFGSGHIPYVYEKDTSPEGPPTLKQLTEAAIKRLQQSEPGFFLMVEGGRIDHALHASKPHVAFEEVLDFEEAVQAATGMTSAEDTLLIVTADHSHVMTLNGYPPRGNDILGTTDYEWVADDLPYTTLMFTIGEAANYTWNGHQVERANLTGVDTRDYNFMPQSAVPTFTRSEVHGGEDVALYARGPMGHLFHRLHEQSYIAHVMGYAACMGPYQDDCGRDTRH